MRIVSSQTATQFDPKPAESHHHPESIAKRPVHKTRLTHFARVLEGVVAKPGSKEKLDVLLQSIDEWGSKLARSLRYEDLIIYRDYVRSFLQEVLSNAYGLKYDAGSHAGYRHKSYVLVERIEENLEKLAFDVLTHEQDPSPGSPAPINVLARIGEIKGLLLDIMG